ncbi:MAG: NADH-quinone oxidoreductase subunit L [Myxococcales bacterium]|nr:NADH-quinone oxidoreductase subunit L [Polyangiaceae bacterium]MDW8248958.1 NADH-quinone oxidoreductase subunit L [Myxococcales bacterium]
MESLFNLYPPTNFSLLGVILGLPLLGAFVNGVFGKRIGRDGVRAMGLMAMGATFLMAVVSFAALHHHAHELHDGSGRITSNPRLVWTAWKWLSLSLGELKGNTTLQVSFSIDPLSATMMLVVTGVGFLIHLYSSEYMWKDAGFYRFFAYLNLFVFSMLVLILGDNLPMLFVGWEGVGLCSYLLIGFWFDEEKNAAAGKKAFIANRIGDFGLLVGMAMLLHYTGSLDFAGISAHSSGLMQEVVIWPIGYVPMLVTSAPVKVYAATLCGLALFLGCTGKSAQIPLYVWLPDAMAGPTPVSALIHAATMVTAGVYLICRLSPVFVLSPAVMAVIATTGALTAFFVATIGLVQNDIKKVLAYSTVSQLGYMFLGVGVGAFADGFFHVFTHAFFKACLFLGAGSVIHAMHARIHDTDASQDMRNMGGLRKYMPYTHATYLISCLAIAGVPLTAGFFSKDEILAKTWEVTVTGAWVASGNLWHPPIWLGKVLFVLGILAATMTAFYMFRTYFLTFWGDFRGWRIVPGWKDPHVGHHGHNDHHHEEFEPGEGRKHLEGPVPHESPWPMTVPLGILAFLAITAGYLNAKIIGESLHIHALTWLDHWLEPVFRQANAMVKTPDFNAVHAWTLAIPGMLAAAAGIGFAYFNYLVKGGELTEKMANTAPRLHELVLDKWRIDELYEATVIGAVDELATIMVLVDKWGVDGLLAKLSALVVAAVGYALRLLQTGRVQVYAAAMVVGTLGVVSFLYLPHPETITREAGNVYKVKALGGVGYTFRWDADGDGKPDSEDFGAVDEIEVRVDPGKTKTVVLEVKNAFGRKARREIAVTRPLKDGQRISLDNPKTPVVQPKAVNQ